MTDKYICYEEESEYFALTEGDLKTLTSKSQPVFKDICLVSVSIGLPTALNAFYEVSKQETFEVTVPIFLNSLVGLVGLLFFLIFGCLWHKNYQSTEELLKTIKNRPKHPFNPATSEVGALEKLEKKIEDLETKPLQWG